MGVFLAIAFVVVPIAEIAVIIAVGEHIGVAATILLLLSFSVVGAVMAKRQGVDVWRRLRATMKQGQIPSSEVLEGFLVLLAAALLLTPGFITDALGLLLLVPSCRTFIQRHAKRLIKLGVAARLSKASRLAKVARTYQSGRVVKVRTQNADSTATGGATTPPSEPPEA